jgi:nicotinate-nucleotide pyrophosphorylase (carboxylating)
VISRPPALEKFRTRISWEDIDQESLMSYLQICLIEETGGSAGNNLDKDITTKVCGISNQGIAHIVARENLIVCGIPLIELIFKVFSTKAITINSNFKDGDEIEKGTSIASIKGNQKDILLIERTTLNFIQKLSGIATESKLYSNIVDKHGVGLLDTRKTTPGLRILEKYATSCGGSFNHRMGLFDRILIKDNHLAAKNIKDAIAFTNMLANIKENQQKIILEVEIDSIDLLIPAINGGVDAVLLDNFSPQKVKEAVNINQERVVLEASGGIKKNLLESYAVAKPHFISTGAPIHASRWVDIGLDW